MPCGLTLGMRIEVSPFVNLCRGDATMKRWILGIAIVMLLVAAPHVEATVVTTVDGTNTVFFAGRTAAELASLPAAGSSHNHYNIDRASAATTLPSSIDVTGLGNLISITAAGTWSHTPSGGSGPDGYNNYDGTHSEYLGLGISPVLNGRLNALLGVFLGSGAPSGSAPAALDVNSDSMSSPLLQQAFLIGSSLENIIVPAGAEQLYFGLNNGYEWSNNSGSVEVTVEAVPEASSFIIWSLIGLSFSGIGCWRRRKAA